MTSLMIPGLPEQFADLPSVQMVPPPASLIADVTRMVEDAAAQLRPGESGRLVWIASQQGINLAVVNKVVENDKLRVTISGWIAKDWGKPIQAGLAGIVSW